MKQIRFAVVLAAILMIAGFCVWAGYQWGHKPPAPPEIRTEIVERMVPVEVVKEIPVEVPGPERVVEKILWRTREVRVPGETVEVIRQIPIHEPITARVLVDATKYEGTVDGRLTRGGVGEARCEVRGESVSWSTLVAEPFDLTLSDSMSTDEPGTLEERLASWRAEVRLGVTTAPGVDVGLSWHRRSRFGWWASLRYDLDPTTSTTFDSSAEQFLTDAADRYELAGGIALTLGRR